VGSLYFGRELKGALRESAKLGACQGREGRAEMAVMSQSSTEGDSRGGRGGGGGYTGSNSETRQLEVKRRAMLEAAGGFRCATG
jgi:hypothetical protein